MLILHASDIHLDSPLVGLEAYEGCPREALRAATRRALANLVTVAIEEQASLVLIAGDLYDGAWRDHSTGLYFVGQMRRLREASIPAVLLRGNHDAESLITKHLKLPDNVRDLSTREPETIRFEELGIAVHGRGFPTRDVREDLAKSYPAPLAGMTNIGMLHTALEGRRGHETYAPTTVEVLEQKGYDYWALGHVHRREVVSRAPFVVYPGNLQGRHVRETGPKGFVLVSIEAGRIASVEERNVDVVRWADCLVEASEEDALGDVLEQIHASLSREVKDADGRLVAARVTVAGPSRIHAEILRQQEGFAADVRAVGLDVAGDGLWIGDVRSSARARVDASTLDASADPLALVMHAAERAERDETVARELVATLDDLAAKLPEELRNDPAFAFLQDPTRVGEVLRDVEELLMGLLVARDPDDKRVTKKQVP